MVKIYRMWRFVRIVEQTLFKDVKGKELLTRVCYDVFCQKRTIFRKKYKPTEAVKAAFMADKLGYIAVRSKDDESYVGITAEGFIFSSPSGLIDKQASALSHTPPLATLLLSLTADTISIIALKK
jgi:hypothetical protein